MDWKSKYDWWTGYPCTVIKDRYNGTYSGAKFLAFPLDFDEVPEDVNGGDIGCAYFWKNYEEPVGKGVSAQEAIDDLVAKIKDEDESERIRKELIEFVKSRGGFKQEYLAWLEKQKEQIPRWEINNPHTTKWTKEMIDEKFEKLVEQKQDWSEEEKDKVVRYLHDMDGGMLWSKATEITSDILDILRPTPKQEWSEEDELMRTAILNTLDRMVDYGTIGMQKDWLKSLRAKPKWKPSEAQMEALKDAKFYYGTSWVTKKQVALESLYEDLKKLM